MKTIVIFCRAIDPQQRPFSDPYYAEAYQDMLLTLKDRGVDAYFATDNATYRGNGVFSRAYTIDSQTSLEDFREVEHVKAGLVLEKGGFTGDDVLVINPPFVHGITSNKFETFKHFGHFQPFSAICQSRAELKAAFAAIKSDLVVVKEPEGNGGELVYIGTRDQVLDRIPDRFPLLAQEFVDTSIGIEGLVSGLHDLRIKIGGGQIFGGQIRTPAPGEYRANMAQGGTSRLLFADEIPAGVVTMAQKIDTFFQDYPRYYAADFVNTPQGWKLIELNSKPGFNPNRISEQSRDLNGHLAEYLIDICT